MNGVTLAKVLNLERWDSNDFGGERPQCLSKRTEVCGTRQNREINIPAEFSGAVRHARLTSHEERPDAVRAHRRKDSEYRVRDQASPRVRGTIPRAFRFPTIVEPGSYGTTQPTRSRQGAQGRPGGESAGCSSCLIQGDEGRRTAPHAIVLTYCSSSKSARDSASSASSSVSARRRSSRLGWTGTGSSFSR